MSIRVFVINLEGSDQRLGEVTRQLSAANLAFDRVAAIDGRGRPPDDFPEYASRQAIASLGRPMLGAEVACYLSHLEAARRFLSTGAPYGLVLEDDATLCPEFADRLQEIRGWLEARPSLRWDLINLGCMRLKMATPLRSFGPFVLHRSHYFAMTTTSLLWSRDGASAFVGQASRIFLPVDLFLRHWMTRSGTGLAVSPPMAPAASASSEIDSQARARSGGYRGITYLLRKQRRIVAGRLIALSKMVRTRVAGFREGV